MLSKRIWTEVTSRRIKTTSLSPFPPTSFLSGPCCWGLVWGVTYLFWPTVTCQALLYSGLGFWWCFHLFWTAWIIPKDQPDLADNGTFFSLILVYFANLLLFLALLRLFNAVSLHRFLADCIHNAEKLWDVLRDLAMLTAGLFL